MFCILGASSHHHAIERRRDLFDSNIITIPGLRLNRQSRAQHKRFQKIQRSPSRRFYFNDAINNSIEKHPFDPHPPLSPQQLVKELKNLKGQCGIVYCQRSGTEIIYSHLAETDVAVLNLLKDLISKRK